MVWTDGAGRFDEGFRAGVKVVAVEHLKGGRGIEVFHTTATHEEPRRATRS